MERDPAAGQTLHDGRRWHLFLLCLVPLDVQPCRIVEHAGVIAPQQLAREYVTGGFVHFAAVHLAAAVNAAVLTDKMLVFCRNVVFDCKRRLRTQLAAQVGVRRADKELIGLLRIVAEAVVEVIVEDRCSGAERHLTAKVGEQIELVVVMLLNDGQR